jgi:hypothetical protein
MRKKPVPTKRSPNELRDDAVKMLLQEGADEAERARVTASIEHLAEAYRYWRDKQAQSPRLKNMDEQMARLEKGAKALLQALNRLHPETSGVLLNGGGVLPLDTVWRKMPDVEREQAKALYANGNIPGLLHDSAPTNMTLTAWQRRVDALHQWAVHSRAEFKKNYLGDGARPDLGGTRNFFTEHGGTPEYRLVAQAWVLLRERPSSEATDDELRDLVSYIYRYATGERDNEISSTVRVFSDALRRVVSTRRQIRPLHTELAELLTTSKPDDPEDVRVARGDRLMELFSLLPELYENNIQSEQKFGSHAHFWSAVPPSKKKGVHRNRRPKVGSKKRTVKSPKP